MLLTPFNKLVVYPILRRFGIEIGALKRMGSGLVFALYTQRYPLQEHYRTA